MKVTRILNDAGQPAVLVEIANSEILSVGPLGDGHIVKCGRYQAYGPDCHTPASAIETLAKFIKSFE